MEDTDQVIRQSQIKDVQLVIGHLHAGRLQETREEGVISIMPTCTWR